MNNIHWSGSHFPPLQIGSYPNTRCSAAHSLPLKATIGADRHPMRPLEEAPASNRRAKKNGPGYPGRFAVELAACIT
jgi:hypothetical protein